MACGARARTSLVRPPGSGGIIGAGTSTRLVTAKGVNRAILAAELGASGSRRLGGGGEGGRERQRIGTDRLSRARCIDCRERVSGRAFDEGQMAREMGRMFDGQEITRMLEVDHAAGDPRRGGDVGAGEREMDAEQRQ